MESSLIIAGAAVVAVLMLTSIIITTFLRSVDAGEILLASRGRSLRIYRGPCKAMIVPVITQVRRIPAQAINVDIEITDQTADCDNTGRPAPVKVTVRASAIVSVGEDEAMVNTAANKFFSKSSSRRPRVARRRRASPPSPKRRPARSVSRRRRCSRRGGRTWICGGWSWRRT